MLALGRRDRAVARNTEVRWSAGFRPRRPPIVRGRCRKPHALQRDVSGGQGRNRTTDTRNPAQIHGAANWFNGLRARRPNSFRTARRTAAAASASCLATDARPSARRGGEPRRNWRPGSVRGRRPKFSTSARIANVYRMRGDEILRDMPGTVNGGFFEVGPSGKAAEQHRTDLADAGAVIAPSAGISRPPASLNPDSGLP